MRFRLELLFVVIGLATLGSPQSTMAAKTASNTLDQSGPATSIQELRARIVSLLARYRVAGAGIALANRDGIIWADGIGLANRATSEPATGATVFRLGSVTKNVNALAAMQLVEEGRLSLDAHLRELAPEVAFDNPWEDTHPVTVGTLFEHTAGFELGRFNEDFEAQPRPLLDALQLNPRARVSRWAPGTRMSYSNEGYDAVGYLLEKLTGRSFDDVVRERVFTPLDMTTTAMRLTPETAAHLAKGYDADGREEAYLEDRQRPAANLLASTNDMARYLVFWLRGGELDGTRLISPASIARMQQRRTLPYAGPDEQYGLGTETAQYDGFVAHGHTGYTNGFVASFRYFPNEGVGWIFMLNQSDAVGVRAQVEDELVGFLLRGRTPPAPATYSDAEDSPAQFAGFYRDVTPGEEIMAPLSTLFGTQVEIRNGALWERTSGVGGLRSLLSLGAWRQLVPTAPAAFRHDDETVSSLFFTHADDGGPVLVTQYGYLARDSMALVLLERGLLLGGIGLMFSALATVPVRLGLEFTTFGALLGPRLGWLPLLLVAVPPVGAWLLLSRSPELLGHVNATTVSLFALSLAFALLAAATVLGAVWMLTTDAAILAKAYVVLVAGASLGLALFAWQAHWIGLRTWLW